MWIENLDKKIQQKIRNHRKRVWVEMALIDLFREHDRGWVDFETRLKESSDLLDSYKVLCEQGKEWEKKKEEGMT